MTQIMTKEEDPDVIHFDNSSDLLFSTSLNDLDNATLHIDGQLTKVDASPDIIDLDEDDDIINDEDALPHDLANYDEEDLVNVDDDDGVDMSADVARGHGGDGGGDDHPLAHHIPTGCGGCFVNRGSDVPRALPWQIGMPRFPFGMIPGTKPESLKIAKTEQRARSYADMDPDGELNHSGEEILRLQALGSNTETGVPYTEEEIMAIVRKGKQRGHLPGVGRVLPRRAIDVNLMMKLFRSDDKFSQMLTQYESSPEFGNASGSGGCGDDEMADMRAAGMRRAEGRLG
ncbi:hypothetical protein Tco_1297289 [Tanacetum coccineum]